MKILVQHGSPNRSHPDGEYPPVVASTENAQMQSRSDSNGTLFTEREAHLCDKAWGAAASEVGQDVDLCKIECFEAEQIVEG